MFRTRDLRLAFPAFGLAALLALAGPAAAQDAAAAPAADAAAAPATDVPTIPNEKCFKCHDDPEMTAESDGRSMAVIEAQFKTGAPQAPRLRRVPHRRAHHQAPAQRPRPGVVRGLHGLPRGRDQPVPGQRPRQGQGRQARVVPGLPRQHPHHAAQQRPDAPMSDVNQVRNCGACTRHDGGLSLQRARPGAVRRRPHGNVAGLQRLPRQPRHHAPRCEGARTSHAKSPETCGECHKAC